MCREDHARRAETAGPSAGDRAQECACGTWSQSSSRPLKDERAITVSFDKVFCASLARWEDTRKVCRQLMSCHVAGLCRAAPPPARRAAEDARTRQAEGMPPPAAEGVSAAEQGAGARRRGMARASNVPSVDPERCVPLPTQVPNITAEPRPNNILEWHFVIAGAPPLRPRASHPLAPA